jgi:hypothetical protein
MEYLCWGLLGLLILWYLLSMKYSQDRRLHLESYIVYLLLSDRIRETHKETFRQWILGADAPDAMKLSQRAGSVIQNMAEGLAKPEEGEVGSTLGAHAMLWRVKQGD